MKGLRTVGFCLAACLAALWLPVPQAGAGDPVGTLRVGIWNIEKLSPTALRGFPELSGANRHPPRTPAQLQGVGRYIRDTLGVKALVVTEIEATTDDPEPRSSQLDVVVAEMGPTWKYVLGRDGGEMRIGLVYDESRIVLKQRGEFGVPEFTVQGEDVFDRDPLVAWIGLLDAEGVATCDLVLVGLHLKSQQHNVDNHLVAMAKVVTELRKFQMENGIGSAERDVLLLGDLNDAAHTRTGFRYLFDYLAAKRYVHLRPPAGAYPATRVNGSQIDHMFASEDLAEREADGPSFAAHGSADTVAYRRDFSDHFPVSVAVRLMADDD